MVRPANLKTLKVGISPSLSTADAATDNSTHVLSPDAGIVIAKA